ncbi:MAG: RNA 2',3'-cyclic phosphodiesterase [Gammaproteobacteria bacterium]|jgi:2'-5' RNA ligase
MDKKFRAFFAIDLPKSIRFEVTSLIKSLKTANPNKNISWIKPENLHITLKFLGNVTQLQYEQFFPEIKTVISGWGKFKIKLDKLVLFPSKRKPRVIALLPSPLEQLIALACKIEEQVVNCNIPAETRSFKPHLTLARIKDKNICELKDVTLPPLFFEIQRVTLFRSEVSHFGSRYVALEHILLR